MEDKNVMVLVSRYNKEKKLFVESIVHVNDCTERDRYFASCPECGQRVLLFLASDRHFEHDLRNERPCKS